MGNDIFTTPLLHRDCVSLELSQNRSEVLGQIMGEKFEIAARSGVMVGAGLLVVSLLSGCFATEPLSGIKQGIQSSVIPNVQRLVNANPFVNPRQETVGMQILTHRVPVSRRDLKMPLSFLLAQTDPKATCTNVDGEVLASFVSLVHVDRVSEVAFQMGNPCNPSESTPLNNFPFDDIHRHWMSVVSNTRFAVVKNHAHWILDPRATAARVAQQRDRVSMVCSDAEERVGVILMQTASPGAPTENESTKMWGMVAVRQEAADGSRVYLATKNVLFYRNESDPAVQNFSTDEFAITGQVMRPLPDGTASGVFRFPKVQLPAPLQNEAFKVRCLVEPTATSIHAENEG